MKCLCCGKTIANSASDVEEEIFPDRQNARTGYYKRAVGNIGE